MVEGEGEGEGEVDDQELVGGREERLQDFSTTMPGRGRRRGVRKE